MNKNVAVNLVVGVIALLALVGWYITSPAFGSGWLIFAAYVATGVFTGSTTASNQIPPLSVGLITLSFSVLSALLWFTGQDLANSGWVGLLALFTLGQGVQELYRSSK